MATVVVLQSDDLAAWIGIAGVVVGVVLNAGMDSVRKHWTASAERHAILRDFGSKVAMAGIALAEIRRAAGDQASQQPWAELIIARKDALLAEYMAVSNAISPRVISLGTGRAERAVALLDAATKLWTLWNDYQSEPDLRAGQRTTDELTAASDEWFRLVEQKDLTFERSDLTEA